MSQSTIVVKEQQVLALVAVQGYVHNLLPSDESPVGGAPEAKKHHASLWCGDSEA